MLLVQSVQDAGKLGQDGRSHLELNAAVRVTVQFGDLVLREVLSQQVNLPLVHDMEPEQVAL